MKNKEYVEINNIKDLESLVIEKNYDIKEIFKGFDIESVDNQFIAYNYSWFYEILGKLTFLKNVRIEKPGTYSRGGGMCEREGEAVYAVSYTHLTLPTTPYV